MYYYLNFFLFKFCAIKEIKLYFLILWNGWFSIYSIQNKNFGFSINRCGSNGLLWCHIITGSICGHYIIVMAYIFFQCRNGF